VARIGQSGRVLPSFPCKRCVPALRNAGIRKVVWFDGQIWMASRL
jgi:deoxycytidylate deaminase